MLEAIYIEGTRKTPSISLDPKGIIKIEGRSIPEDAELFFSDLINWLHSYLGSGNPSTRVDLSFEYLNSGTSKVVLQMLKALKDLCNEGHQLTVNWYYEEGDDDILERGEYYASIIDLKINFLEVE
ncbi:MAG: DUF1987 domain-containing protein [Bacteroidales bacterium]|nr:DUF1987 domain-containing protein [Bacteroidales bacterium]MCB8998492.1 DUF1987 domain-containing protein [Bacteroidales bacterium]MCB9012933.1 DUF1987 domain-containing protein [Bacteroidales bacterium]